MMKAIPAIYQNGAFHPLAPIELPEQTNVEVLLPASSDEAEEFQALLRTAGAWAGLPDVEMATAAMEEYRRDAQFRDEAT